MPMIADQPITEQPPAPPIFIEDQIAELASAVADLTKVVVYLASTKTLPVSTEAAMLRLKEFCGRIQS
jgi:hypothetical protein